MFLSADYLSEYSFGSIEMGSFTSVLVGDVPKDPTIESPVPIAGGREVASGTGIVLSDQVLI